MPSSFLALFLVWMACAVYFVRDTRSQGSGIFLLAYFTLTFINFVPGPMIRLFPGLTFFDDETVRVGLMLATLGIVVFTLSAWLSKPKPKPVKQQADPIDTRNLRLLLVFLSFAAVVVSPFVGRTPSISQVVAQLTFAIGAVFLIGSQQMLRTRRAYLLGAALIVAAPVISMIALGFLGYGFGISILIAIIFYRQAKSVPLAFYISIPLVTFLALSVFVTYNRDRSELRDSAWRVDANISETTNIVSRTFSKMEYFDPSNTNHRVFLEARLNQSAMVGEAELVTRIGGGDFLYGDSLKEALIAPIPRIIWRDKPYQAGSGNYVSRVTGLNFNDETSVGLTHLMEFYVNFGVPSLVIGMALLGFVLRRIDSALNDAQQNGDGLTVVTCFLVGNAMLGVGGSIAEMTSVMLTAYLTSLLIRLVFGLVGK